MSNGDTFRELIEVYALGSMDAADRAAVEAHLATGCQECAQALEEARWLVSQLAYLAPEEQPSDMLRGRLLKTVREEAAASAPAKSAIPFWMWAGVAALLLFAIYTTWESMSLQKQIVAVQKQADDEIAKRQELEQQFQTAKNEAIILTDPRSVKIPLPGDKKDPAQVGALWHAKLGILVTGFKAPVPSGDRTYQLWLIPKTPNGKPIPSVAVHPEADGTFKILVSNPPDAMAATKALAITEEPAGGSSAPTTKPLWAGSVG